MPLLGHKMERSQATLQRGEISAQWHCHQCRSSSRDSVRSPAWQTVYCCPNTGRHRGLDHHPDCCSLLAGLPPAWHNVLGQLTLLPRLPLACLEKSSATMSACPSWEARCKGVTPCIDSAFAEAPYCSRLLATSIWFCLAAMCRGVYPFCRERGSLQCSALPSRP